MGHLLNRVNWDLIWASGSVPTPAMLLGMEGQWCRISEPCALPQMPPGRCTWRHWPQMQSKAAWKEGMRAPAERVCKALERSGHLYPECQLCPNARNMEEHITGPGHFYQMWTLIGDAPVDLERFWQMWDVSEGCQLRFNYIDGAIEMRRGHAPSEASGIGNPASRIVRPPPPGMVAEVPVAPPSQTTAAAASPVYAPLTQSVRPPWLAPTAEVEGFWTADEKWYPCVIRQVIEDDQGTFVDVLWDGERTVSLFAVEKLRPRALALQRSYAAAAIVTQQQKLQQKHMQLTPPVSALAYVGVMTPEIELALRNNEAVTPSHGYLTPSSVTNHAWMCHMCRKKFLCAEGVTPHLETKIHDRRRQLTYSFADWVAYNFGFGFYELEAELAQHGPPPPQHLVAPQFASAEASEVNPQRSR